MSNSVPEAAPPPKDDAKSGSTDAGASQPSIRTCPYCLEAVHPRALKCKHCLSFLSERGRQQAIREFLTSIGFRSVEVGKPGVFGLSIPGALLFFAALYFAAKGLFAILGSQPALLQALLGIVGVLVALAFFRSQP